MSDQNTMDDALTALLETTRRVALLDAAQLLIERAQKMQSFQLSEMRTLKNAAEAITQLAQVES